MLGEDLSLNSVLQKYDQYSTDYERRFISSLGIFSAAGLAFCFTSSRFVDQPERFLMVILPSLWLFVFALILSGLASFCKSLQYRKVRNSVYSGMRAKLLQDSSLNRNSEQNAEEEIEKLLSEEDIEYTAYKLWMRRARRSLVSACIALIGAIVWPLILLTFRGYI